MVDVRCRLAYDLKEFSYKAQTVCSGAEKGADINRDLNLTSSKYQVANQSSDYSERTSFSHFVVAINACAASPMAPRILSTSNQKRNFCSKKSSRAETTSAV